MDVSIFFNLRINMLALIVLVATTPFLLFTIRNVMLSKASKRWIKINGMITTTEGLQLGIKYGLYYANNLGDHALVSSRIFDSKITVYIKRLAAEFDHKYLKYQMVNMFNNPKRPKLTVFEPSGTDDVFWFISVLGILYMVSSLSVFVPFWYIEVMEFLNQLINLK